MKQAHLQNWDLEKQLRGDREKFYRRALFLREKMLDEKKIKYRSFLPTYYEDSVYTIDYNILDLLNKKTLFFDIDNTIIENGTTEVKPQLSAFLNDLKKRNFSIHLVSNASKRRAQKIAGQLEISYLSNAMKPFKKRTVQYMKKHQIKPGEVAFIGDQVMTDIHLANKLGMLSILIKPINNTNEPFRTKFNRRRERKRLKYFKEQNVLIDMGGK